MGWQPKEKSWAEMSGPAARVTAVWILQRPLASVAYDGPNGLQCFLTAWAIVQKLRRMCYIVEPAKRAKGRNGR